MIIGLKTSRNNSLCKLNLRMDGADNGTTFTDSSPSGKTVTRSGTVTKTAIKQFGTASGYTPGGTSNYYLSIPASGDFKFTIPYTVSIYCYLTNVSAGRMLFHNGNNAT